MSFKGKRVLVTGGTGFIGSALVERLLSEGANVTLLIRDQNFSQRKDLLSRCTVYVGEIDSYKDMSEIVSYTDPQVIFHLAAYAIVKASSRDPLNTYRVNVMGTVTLLEALRTVGKPELIVVASSDKAYGDHENLPYKEDFPLVPKNTYDTSKACMDMISQTYANNYGMPITVTRCSNVYGPGDYNFTRIVPNTIRRLLQGKAPELYRDVAEMVRELIYIDDVVDAYMTLVNTPEPTWGEVFNIGGTGFYEIQNIIDEISLTVTGKIVPPRIIDRDKFMKEIREQYIDSSKLQALGWKPRTTLSEGLRKTVEWHRSIT